MQPDRSAPDKRERKSWLGALAAIKILETRPGVTLPALCHELAAAHGNKIALSGPEHDVTYRQLSERINRYTSWAKIQAQPGETISSLMPNSPDYAAAWLGISQAGCAAALLNTALPADALVHCILAAGSNTLIFSARFLAVVEACMDLLPATMRYWMLGDAETSHPIQRCDIDSYPPSGPAMQTAPRNIAVLIYTSGTTGLPKAARLTHARLIEWSFWFAGLLEITPEDRVFNCLPMYHSTGGIVAIGAALVRGGTVIIRERFSAAKFWDDIVAEKCTIFMYIGELCRYITGLQPAEHQLRLCCGNGLSGDVWEIFQSRCNIPRIIEFYAATEGSVSLYNCAGKPGAIGHVPAFLAHNFPVILVKLDAATGEISRDADGLCILCGDDEPGEALGKIAGFSNIPSRQFDGYTDAQASNHKMLHDVQAAGDTWFRTGDLMRRDATGFYYFVERLGETFRWKGENVSAEEVANVIRSCPGVSEGIVFGVAIPGHEGRAGMAVITVHETFSFHVFLAHVTAKLPGYARPMFISIVENLPTTGTFKYKKDAARMAEALFTFNLQNIWFYDRTSETIVKWNKLRFEQAFH